MCGLPGVKSQIQVSFHPLYRRSRNQVDFDHPDIQFLVTAFSGMPYTKENTLPLPY